MMSPKDVARKMLVGCGHTKPVIIPHEDCVEIQLAQWEANIRLDCARTLANTHKQTIEDSYAAVEKAKREVELLGRKIDAMNRNITALSETNASLKERLRVALADADNLRASLKAELTQKHYAKYPPQAISE